MTAVQIPIPLAQAPELGASAEASGDDAARAVVLPSVQAGVRGRGAIAHVDARVIPLEIVPAHPEGAVVGVHEAQFLLDVGMLLPFGGLVGPIPLPFEGAPWIAQLEQLDPGLRPPDVGVHGEHPPRQGGNFLGIGHLHGLDERIGVPGGQPFLLEYLFPRGARIFAVRRLADAGAHEGLLTIVPLEERPNVILGVRLVGLFEPARASVLLIVDRHHILPVPRSVVAVALLILGHLKDVVPRHGVPSPQYESAVEGRVAAAEFRVRLFQHDRPQFAPVGIHEAGSLRPLLARDAIVDPHHGPLLLDRIEDAHGVHAPGIVFDGPEQPAYRIGMLGGARERGDQPTISDGALTQIVRLDLPLEQLRPIPPEGVQFVSTDPIGIFGHILRGDERPLLGMSAQGRGAVEIVVDVRPSAAEAARPVQDVGDAEGYDPEARPEIYFEGAVDHPYRGDEGAAQDIPQGGRLGVVKFFGCGEGHACGCCVCCVCCCYLKQHTVAVAVRL
mmetsp:Transcript_13956/g.40844  ORF Transcript_13956/g.40844 Transcript_13956/m.40844 type:complete len:502 (-) Transcript_13956:272-1777(-)